MAPVVHTNQEDQSVKASNTIYWDQSHPTSAGREGYDYELDDRKPAAPVQDTAPLNRGPAQHTAWSADQLRVPAQHTRWSTDQLRVPAQHTTWSDPQLEHSSPSTQILGEPELYSSVMRSWQHNEDDCQYDYGSVARAPYPEQYAQVLAAPPAPEMRWSPPENYTALPASDYTAPPQAGSPDYSRTNGQRPF